MRSSIVATTVLAVLLAGCGSNAASKPDDARSVLAAAPQRTFEEGSAAITVAEQQDDHLPLPGQKARGEISFDARVGRMQLAGEEHVYTATHWFVDTGKPLTGKTWLRFPRDEFGVNQDDRLRLISYLAAGVTDASHGEAASINGAGATRYETTVEVQKALKAVPEVERALVKAVLEDQLLGQSGHVDFWLDSEGRLRRIRSRVPPHRTYTRTEPDGDSVSHSTDDFTLTSTFDFEAFGVAIDAEPPPDDQVADPLQLQP